MESKEAQALNLKKLVAEDRLKPAIEQLLPLLDGRDEELYNQVVVLAGKHHHLQLAEIAGTQAPGQLNLQKNQLRQGLLEIVDLWKQQGADPMQATAMAETKKREVVRIPAPGSTPLQAIFLKTTDYRVAEQYYVIEEEAVIGRAPECQIRIDHPYVSRMHARLYLENGKAYLEDLGSSNGTFLEENSVEVQEISKAGTIRVDEVIFQVSLIYGKLG